MSERRQFEARARVEFLATERVGMVGAFCPACGERVRPGDPQLQRDTVRWHLRCTTFELDLTGPGRSV